MPDSGMGFGGVNASVGRSGGEPSDVEVVLRQLLWEQRQTNIMLWAALTPAQRDEVTLYTDNARQRWYGDEDPGTVP